MPELPPSRFTCKTRRNDRPFSGSQAVFLWGGGGHQFCTSVLGCILFTEVLFECQYVLFPRDHSLVATACIIVS
jgi:hypothetical protein